MRGASSRKRGGVAHEANGPMVILALTTSGNNCVGLGSSEG